jgi:catechol 2,3-dioxygenase-like lactoylglutathione lyase family enzyme
METPFFGLDHVQVAAPPGCEVAARRFYGELLGLVEIEKPPLLATRGGVWFAVGDRQLHVGVDVGFVPARKAHPALRLADRAALETLAGRLAEAGIEATWADAAELPDASRFYVHDPWGNRLELIAYA